MLQTALQPALFLDRDGVINVDYGYVHHIEDFDFVHGIFDVCRAFVAAGYRIVIVTNQSGIARGFFDTASFNRLTVWMRDQFLAAGIPLAAVYHCPHHPASGGPLGVVCNCRKPKPGLLLRAAAELGIDLDASVLIGDRWRDIEAARRAGIRTAWLVSTSPDEIARCQAAAVFPSMAMLESWVALNTPKPLQAVAL